jgi:putative two-component system response regulator
MGGGLLGTIEAGEQRGRTEEPVTVEAALARCRALYAEGRSADAIPLARVALSRAREQGARGPIHRALAACGILYADTFDVVGGVEFHLESIRLAEKEGDLPECSRAWGNIGLALALAGSPATAIRAYGRAIDVVESIAGPMYSRYSARANRSHSLFQLSAYEEGLQEARRALQELTPEFIAQDRHGAILLLRNVVQLMVATGNAGDAGIHVEELTRLASETDSPRAFIAAATARASYELARGHRDVALTRLEQALAKARETPTALRDALVCMMRAEELAGSPERALARLEELSQHVFKTSIERARRSVELAGLDQEPPFAEHARLQTKARLESRLGRPQAPGGWDALRRLAASAALRLDNTGLHGIRVGALTKALALACGEPPLQALEIGLAAELHDIGMLSVPEAILARRGAIRESERDAYYQHTVAGADILREERHSRFLMARDVAMYHHAWWDGTGYPEKVGGRFIPLAARMCAVADTYDELVCGFRAPKGMSMKDALDALRSKAGTQLDPELVDRFISVVSDETASQGIDPALDTGLEGFQELIDTLQQDRGYV